MSKILIEEIGALTADRARALATCAEWAFTEEVSKYVEVACVGARIGGDFTDPRELHVMAYKEAVSSPDRPYWLKAIEEEHTCMMECGVWMAVNRKDVPKEEAKVIDSTWAPLKKKSNGTYRARINAQGFCQVAGVHYDSASISAPVTNDVTIRICLVLMLMMGGVGKLCDVKGAFLHGSFSNSEETISIFPKALKSIIMRRHNSCIC
jgi:Reverse transcriptase (RNA-dependent DNA polymerase).